MSLSINCLNPVPAKSPQVCKPIRIEGREWSSPWQPSSFKTSVILSDCLIWCVMGLKKPLQVESVIVVSVILSHTWSIGLTSMGGNCPFNSLGKSSRLVESIGNISDGIFTEMGGVSGGTTCLYFPKYFCTFLDLSVAPCLLTSLESIPYTVSPCTKAKYSLRYPLPLPMSIICHVINTGYEWAWLNQLSHTSLN